MTVQTREVVRVQVLADDVPLLLNQTESSILLGLSKPSFEALVREGKLTPVKTGERNKRVWRRDDLLSYVRSLPAVSAK